MTRCNVLLRSGEWIPPNGLSHVRLNRRISPTALDRRSTPRRSTPLRPVASAPVLGVKSVIDVGQFSELAATLISGSESKWRNATAFFGRYRFAVSSSSVCAASCARGGCAGIWFGELAGQEGIGGDEARQE